MYTKFSHRAGQRTARCLGSKSAHFAVYQEEDEFWSECEKWQPPRHWSLLGDSEEQAILIVKYTTPIGSANQKADFRISNSNQPIREWGWPDPLEKYHECIFRAIPWWRGHQGNGITIATDHHPGHVIHTTRRWLVGDSNTKHQHVTTIAQDKRTTFAWRSLPWATRGSHRNHFVTMVISIIQQLMIEDHFDCTKTRDVIKWIRRRHWRIRWRHWSIRWRHWWIRWRHWLGDNFGRDDINKRWWMTSLINKRFSTRVNNKMANDAT